MRKIRKLIFLTSLFLLIHSTFAGRLYDPEFGRWLNRDPIGVNGGINIYNSVSNNMVNGFSGGEILKAGMEKEVGKNKVSAGVDGWGENMLMTNDVLHIKGMMTFTRVNTIINLIKVNAKKIGIDFQVRKNLQLSDGEVKFVGDLFAYNLSIMKSESDAKDKIEVLHRVPEWPFLLRPILYTEFKPSFALAGYTHPDGAGILVDVFYEQNNNTVAWVTIHEMLAHMYSGYKHFTFSHEGKWKDWDKSLTGVGGGGTNSKIQISNCVKKWIEEQAKKQGRSKPKFDRLHLLEK